MLTKPINTSLFFLGLIFAAISVLCSVLLWASFANSWLDYVIATLTAAALVIASYVFVPVIIRAIELKKPLTATAMLLLEAALISTSIAATIGWIESRYQSNYFNEIQSSDTYKSNRQQIADLDADIKLLRASAENDLKNDYRKRALRTMAKIEHLSDKRDSLINQRTTAQHQSSGTSLGNNLDEDRWYLWTALAVLVDGCPLACFAILSMRSEKPVAVQNSPAAVITKPATPAKIAARAQVTDTNLKEEITKGIRAKRWGDKPAIRNVIADTKGRYPEVKAIFDDLLNAGVLKMNGTRFERVA